MFGSKDKVKVPHSKIFHHPKSCTCKICKFIKENNEKGLPIIYHLCPAHYSTFFHSHVPFLSIERRIFLKLVMLLQLFKVVKVRYIDDSCDFCRISDGGIGNAVTPSVS